MLGSIPKARHGVQTPTNHREGGVCLRACWGAWGLPFGLPEQRRGYGHEGMPGRKKGHASKPCDHAPQT